MRIDGALSSFPWGNTSFSVKRMKITNKLSPGNPGRGLFWNLRHPLGMCRRVMVSTLNLGLMAVFLVGCLLAGGVGRAASGLVGSVIRDISAGLRDSGTQGLVFGCLAVYFPVFYLLRRRAEVGLIPHGPDGAPQCGVAPPLLRHARILCLACALGTGAMLYAIDPNPSTLALTWLAGAVIGKVFAFWTGLSGRPPASPLLTGFLLIALLTLASVWNVDSGRAYVYQRQERWCGPWANPNLFGLLMGTGMVLAIGIATSRRRRAGSGGLGAEGAGRLAKFGN
jgi:hypothetical protein